MEKRKIEISLDTAKEWYLKGGNLKEVALQAFSEEELKQKEIKVWEDLLGKSIAGYFLTNYSEISIYHTDSSIKIDRNIFLCEKQAKSALAMAQISQLLPYYNPNWENGIPNWSNNSYKAVITSFEGKVDFDAAQRMERFLAFETKEIAKKFYEANEQLVKDYLMID